ncbi:protein GAMETE EXPRESSED 1 [Durio zibethinus]|uniref:Protein GAMETE EXPRESSED 1 n=1 Tax=Durio zibethinus TaxID=66656 RepID=A0A6P5Y245_DURZI|nr:protein GAMETE EXPRESSED 1 [Durio zibethinus]XP_022734466.1 protein GAMETE EXPRESSED 1 [Durio zibethinus]
MDYHQFFLSLMVLLSVSPRCQSWGLFSSSSQTKAIRHGHDSVPEFSMEGLNNEKGIRLLQGAKNKLVGSNSCWKNAYGHLLAGCKEIIATDEKRSRFAWHLSDCFQKDSGRSPFPFCDTKSAMVYCLKQLNDLEHKVYLEFLLETNSICYQLQNQAFKHDTERLVNELTNSAKYAEDKLDSLEDRTNVLLQNSNQIHDSLNAIDVRIYNVDQTTNSLESHMDSLIEHSHTVYKQASDIAALQIELRNGQAMMNDQLTEGIAMLDGAYKNLGLEVDNLRNEAIAIESEISKVGNAMSSSMNNLQRTADDIGNMAGVSLDKQQQLLEVQSTALEGLRFLTRFQSEALEESRNTLQHLAEYGRKQQEELLKRQEQLQQVHDHLVENSKSILAAQDAFESKQASMFVALDKLFALHNAMLLESRLIKAFFVYSMSIFIVYMFTSTKQTYPVRPRLYIGLCATFLIEVAVLRFTANDIELQTWMVNVVRSIFVLIASIQLLHAICTYRDYEFLNHQMLLTLIEKVNNMQSNKALSWEMDSDVDWPSWIDAELPEEVEKLEDPDYIVQEEVGENSITTSSITRKYNLRHRKC